MTKVLSEATYNARKADLSEAKRLAEEAYRHACYQLETSTGTGESVACAKHHLDGVIDRIANLEAAWVAGQEVQTEAGIEVTRKAWADARATAEGALKERELAAVTIVNALGTVGDGFDRFTKANDKIVEKMRPFMASRFDDFAALRDGLASSSSSVEFLIAGLLRNRGINFAGVDFGAAKSRADSEGVLTVVSAANAVVAARVDAFKPEVVQ